LFNFIVQNQNMNTGICKYSYIPVRKEPSESAEMVSQVLYGETYAILDQNQKWLLIELEFDNYKGWIDRKLSCEIDDQKHTWLNNASSFVANVPLNQAIGKNGKSPVYLLAGSDLFELKGKNFLLFDESFNLVNAFPDTKNLKKPELIVNLANQLINVPYLWGGRSTFGIDCSGLVQTAFKVAGIRLPRDAYQQAKLGKKIALLNESLPGDLAFFENEEGRIVHTGILLSESEIIHSSGCVHKTSIDEKGIWNNQKKEYSHKLTCIRRMIG
jgi:gamma-D-glutamyl-L-lysine dipeptidyl-peptidase